MTRHGDHDLGGNPGVAGARAAAQRRGALQRARNERALRGEPRSGSRANSSVVGALDAEADLHLNLEVRDLTVGDVAADRRHLEPVEAAYRLRGPGHPV